MKRFLLVCCFMINILSSFAQGENNNWHFGLGHALNFNQNPLQLIQSNIQTFEGCSAVSDATGNLLFYTIGSRIWDKYGTEMPNAYGLLGNLASSSADGVAIVRNPGNPNQYYVFCGDSYEDTVSKLYYSLVDMTLNNGLGDVVPSVKNVVLMNNVSEQICTTNGFDCKSSWIIARERTTYSYKAFKIDANGVNPAPVITPANGNLITPYITSNLTFAPDGITAASGGPCLTIEKFNNITGAFTDFILLDTFISGGTYNPEFSPDGSKLYYTYNASVGTTPAVFQMDLSLMPDTHAVINSSTSIILSSPLPFSFMFLPCLRRAPDGKIYTLDYAYNNNQLTQHIGRFENPNVAGAGCNFTPAIFTIQSDSIFFEFGAPVFIQSPDTVFYHIDTFLCEGTSIQLSSSIDSSNYIWNNPTNTTQTISIQTPGNYWVNATLNGCSNTLDSFYVSQKSFKLELNNDTTICKGDSIDLNAIPIGLETELFWNTGERTKNILVDTQGVYSVIAHNVCGTFSDSVKVELIGCYCVPFLPTAFSPNGDLLNDDFGPFLDCSNISDYSFSIYNRFGQRIFIANNPTDKWNGNKADIGSYFYYLTFKNQQRAVVSYKGDVALIR